MVDYRDAVAVVGLMLADRAKWYDRQAEVLSDRRYRAQVLAGFGNMNVETLRFKLGRRVYVAMLDHKCGEAYVAYDVRMGVPQWQWRVTAEGVDDGVSGRD